MDMLNVLIVGSGGREHALAWKVAESPRRARLYVAPGNAGTAQIGENVSLSADSPGSFQQLIEFARQKQVHLVIVGPEVPLAAGLADELSRAGIPVFGPGRDAAQIEASKAFAKAFMSRHALPTARYAIFNNYDEAVEHLRQLDYPVVIKASGLAAGKGVLLPQSFEDSCQALKAMLVDLEFGASGQEVVIEERLSGPEVSVMAFCDGRTIRLMPPAQDHKRLLTGDLGPNTGGMGAYAPAPVCSPALLEEIERTILQPAVDGLRQEGKPFVGVLYAGLMLTAQGPQLLEFNCRFGDPETQVILPLLKTDLLDIAEACVLGRLDQLKVQWHSGAAACVVLASEGYPGRSPVGRAISGLDEVYEHGVVFHAATRRDQQMILTSGGRVVRRQRLG